MAKPEEFDREYERFMAALPDGGEQLMMIADMVGAMVRAMREK